MSAKMWIADNLTSLRPQAGDVLVVTMGPGFHPEDEPEGVFRDLGLPDGVPLIVLAHGTSLQMLTKADLESVGLTRIAKRGEVA